MRLMEPMLKVLVMPLEAIHQILAFPINLMVTMTKGGPFMGTLLPGPL